MLTKEMEKALNGKITIEAESSQVYLAMASWAETQGMEGVAEFMYMHSDEERMHMLKLVKYVNERGGHAKISSLKAPPLSFGSFNACLSLSVFIDISQTLFIKSSLIISEAYYYN